MSSEEHDSSADRWLVSYADLVTLMFAFFVVLYATSEKDLAKSTEFQESVKRYLIKAGAFGESGPSMKQGQKNNEVIEPPIPTYGNKSPETAAVMDQAEAHLEAKLTKEQRNKYVIDLVSDEWGVRLILSAEAIYAKDSDKFQESAMPFIESLGDLLVETKRKLLIEGHVKAGERGPFRSTWDLSSSRAVNLLRYMMLTKNVEGERLGAAAFGESRPLTANSKDAANSRIEIVILSVDREL